MVPRGRMNEVSRMRKTIHASEDKQAVLEKAKAVAQKLKEKKLGSAADKVEQRVVSNISLPIRPFNSDSILGSDIELR